jgi:DNA-binding protein Fis
MQRTGQGIRYRFRYGLESEHVPVLPSGMSRMTLRKKLKEYGIK